MKQDNIQYLKTSDISSDVFIVSPAQIDFISKKFGDAVADAMNMRMFAPKIKNIAQDVLRKVLTSAHTMGE